MVSALGKTLHSPSARSINLSVKGTFPFFIRTPDKDDMFLPRRVQILFQRCRQKINRLDFILKGCQQFIEGFRSLPSLGTLGDGKWNVPSVLNCQRNLAKCIPSRTGEVAILLVASCYGNRDKLRQ